MRSPILAAAGAFGLVGLGLYACNTPAEPTAAGTAVAAPAAGCDGGLAPDTVVATWDGGQVTYGELTEELGVKLVQIEVEYLTNKYNAESQGLDQMVVTKLLEAEAGAAGKPDVETLLKEEVESKVAAPTEASSPSSTPSCSGFAVQPHPTKTSRTGWRWKCSGASSFGAG